MNITDTQEVEDPARLFLGKVTDMFDFRLIRFPVFNVADACITISGVLMVLMWIREAIEERRQPSGSSPETNSV